ncbi:MAG: hypothetical protein EPN26_10385 [Rhodospirillales bacterium]|nr:MAG: hypothetical protein EPN26_10385 [Rhodospirillales bacterium]
MTVKDLTLAYLLDLDGEAIVYDSGHVARFRVKRIAPTPEKPHGISYSLTLHAPDGHRLMGYDNAHAVAPKGSRFAKRQASFDHWHRDNTDEGRPYAFVSATKLIADFFDEVARIVKELEDNG